MLSGGVLIALGIVKFRKVYDCLEVCGVVFS